MHITKKNLFIIGYGSINDIEYYEVINAPDLETASKEAWELACSDYDNYVGVHGIRDFGEIMEEEECDEEEAGEIFNEERESWLSYTCFPYSKEEEKLCRPKCVNFLNPFKHITNAK